MSKTKRKKIERSKCKECGLPIWKFPRHIGLPCNEYCCACCPKRWESPCPKEKKFGTPTECLAKMQLDAEQTKKKSDEKNEIAPRVELHLEDE